MSITEGTQPAAVTWTGAWTSAQTTASFTPESGALLVALLAADGNQVAGTVTGSITDSLSGSWTLLLRQNTTGTNTGGTTEVWVRDSPGTSLTVSATGTGNPANGGQLVVRTLIGAKAAASQTGAKTGATEDPAAAVQVSVTAGTGNKIYGAAFNFDTSTAMTLLGNTSNVANFADSTNGDNWAAFKSTGDTAGTATYGYSTSVHGMIAAVEILAAPATGASAVQAAGPFQAFTAPWIDPSALPFQLLGDATTPAGNASITLTDSGSADDSSFVVTVTLPLSDTGAADDSSFSVSNLDPNQALPAVAWMFLEPSAASFQLLGDATTNAAVPITLLDTGAAVDAISVNITDYGSPVNLTGPFPPFAPPFTAPLAVPFQLLGDASGQTLVSLTDAGAADDSSFTVSAAVPLSDTGAGADAVTVTAAVPLTDAGSADDTSLTIAAAVPLTDSGTGTDAISVQVFGQADPYQAPVLQFPAFTAPFIDPTAIPFQLLGDQSAAAQISLTDTGSADDTSLVVTAAVPLTDAGAAADAATVTAATPLADTASAADTLATTATVPLTDTGSADDSSFTVLVQVDSPQPFRYFAPFSPGLWTMAADTPLQLLGDATGPPVIPIVPPITVTGSSSAAVSVAGATSAATTVTGSSAPAITVR